MFATPARLKQRAIRWAARRQGIDPNPVTLHRRRVYILPTRHGILFGLAVFVMLLASLNYNNNLGLLLTFMLAGSAIVALFRCQRNLVDLTVNVRPAKPTFVGMELLYPVIVHHDSRSCIAIDGGTRAVNVPAGQTATLHIARATRQRGRQRPGRFSLSTTYPLGLFRAWVWLEINLSSLAWPRPAATPAPSAPSAATGTAAGTSRDGDDDFAGLRQWQEGDPIRRVDWHALARGRGLLTKQFTAAPPELDVFDLDALTALPLEQALSRLTRSVLDADAAGHDYRLHLGDRTIGPDNGPAHRDRCLTALALYQP